MKRKEYTYRYGGAAFVLLLSFAFAAIGAGQQIVDPDFKPAVANPAYRAKGPVVGIDEAHANFHTAGGQYKPFADLLGLDGYQVKPATRKFDKNAFTGIDVLVIANALSDKATRENPGLPAFTDAECDAVRDWVWSGGSLLLISDHSPFGSAAEELGKRFGVVMGKGWAYDRTATGVTTQLVFSRENGLLGSHPIIKGRNSAEAVKLVRSFTGQSLSVPAGAVALLKLSPTTREAPTNADVDAEQNEIRTQGAVGSHSRSTTGQSQGLAMTFGKGRVVVLGEAGMFSAQIATLTNGDQKFDMKFGMNVDGTDDRQFALNVVHWLSKLLK
jgi:hypothetical protein